MLRNRRVYALTLSIDALTGLCRGPSLNLKLADYVIRGAITRTDYGSKTTQPALVGIAAPVKGTPKVLPHQMPDGRAAPRMLRSPLLPA